MSANHLGLQLFCMVTCCWLDLCISCISVAFSKWLWNHVECTLWRMASCPGCHTGSLPGLSWCCTKPFPDIQNYVIKYTGSRRVWVSISVPCMECEAGLESSLRETGPLERWTRKQTTVCLYWARTSYIWFFFWVFPCSLGMVVVYFSTSWSLSA